MAVVNTQYCCGCRAEAVAGGVPSTSGSTSSVSNIVPQVCSIPDPRPKLNVDTGIDVAKYVEQHVKPYDGPSSFLAGPTERTKKLWKQTEELICKEIKKGEEEWEAQKHVLFTMQAWASA